MSDERIAEEMRLHSHVCVSGQSTQTPAIDC